MGNRISGVMVSMMISSAVHRRFKPRSGKTKDYKIERIGGVIVSMMISSAVHRGFKPRSGKTKDYNIDIYYYSVKH